MRKTVPLIFLSVLFICFFYADSLQKDLSQNLIRLHIIANSNSESDQQIKREIRDEIIKNAGNKFSADSQKAVFSHELCNNLDEIEKIADFVLKKHNADYQSEAYLKKTYIPKKVYNGIILPEGSYDSLTVKLGNGNGENWWCVVYPPLCFTESVCGKLSEEGKEKLKNTLSPDAYSLITSEEFSVEYAFKFVELVQKIKKYLQ